MIRRSGGNWTAGATDEVLPIFLPERSHAAKLFENPKRGIDSLPSGLAFYFAKVFLGYGSASRAHSSAQNSWLKALRKDSHDKRDQTPIRFWKHLFGFRPKNIRDVRLANSWPHTRLGHKPVPLKTGKMRAYRIVGQVQCVREFVHCALSNPEELKYFSAGTFEQAVSPAYILH